VTESGAKDLSSVETPAFTQSDLLNIAAGQLSLMGQWIEESAGPEVRRQVMLGADQRMPAGTPEEGALGCKAAIDRLDALTSPEDRQKIMNACGRACQSRYDFKMAELKDRRKHYPTEADFLAELRSPDASMAYEFHGRELIQYHYPAAAGHGFRCSCFLMAALPAGVEASPTFCQCSRAFVQQRWEKVLGRELKVDVAETAITGADHCRFIIHL